MAPKAAAPPRAAPLLRRALLPVLAAVACVGVDRWTLTKRYEFSTDVVAGIANEARLAGGNATDVFARVEATFKARYPGHVLDSPWIFMRAGGWMGSFKLLYASTTEYVLLFGTGVPTSGHSGRYWGHITDTLVTGRFLQWNHGELAPVEHGPGATVHHPRWEATGVAWDAGTWMVEHYSAGFVPSALPFAFADGVFSAVDVPSLGRYVWEYGRHLLWNAAHCRF